MCRVHKFSETPENSTNLYVFKSFTNSTIETSVNENEIIDSSNDYMEKLKLIQEKIKRLQADADCIIENAENEAKKIVENANHEAVTVLNASSIEGYRKGVSLANEKTEEIIRSAKTKAAGIIEKMKENSDEIINSLEDDMINLSFDIAKKIIDVELDRNDDVLVSIIKNALGKFKSDTNTKIVMQAQDLAKLDEDIIKSAINDKSTNIEFMSGSEMKKGDLIIETERGSVDAGVNSQFVKIKNAFTHKKVNAL